MATRSACGANGETRGGGAVHLGGRRRDGRKASSRPLRGSRRSLPNFFQWEPQPPRSAAQLAAVRPPAFAASFAKRSPSRWDERSALAHEPRGRTGASSCFPDATDAAFADGYAQAVTFGLLMARARNITLADGLDRVARRAAPDQHPHRYAALRLLTDEADSEAALKTSLATLTRVLDAVHWPDCGQGRCRRPGCTSTRTSSSVYDNDLRRRTGSYYTPPQVVRAMVRLVDDALRCDQRFSLSEGLASSDVTVADPAT